MTTKLCKIISGVFQLTNECSCLINAELVTESERHRSVNVTDGSPIYITHKYVLLSAALATAVTSNVHVRSLVSNLPI